MPNVLRFDPSRCRVKPFDHQVIDAQSLIENPFFGLFSEMGTGKSATVIYAACTLAEAKLIDTVVVCCPASVRCVWKDFEIGEIKKHSWVTNHVFEFHSKSSLVWGEDYKDGVSSLDWWIVNYEFIRNEEHLKQLCSFLRERTILLVLDESSYVKNRSTQQMKAVTQLRQHCARCVLLNGTPLTNSPLDLWAQMKILSSKILNFQNFYAFRARYCDLQTQHFGQRSFKTVTGYKNLDDLAKRIAPWVVRREKRECLSLPEKLYTVREVSLSAESWRRYQMLKREAIVSLNGNLQLEPNAAVRIMRLAQLTSGILGSVSSFTETNLSEDRHTGGSVAENCPIQDVSDEKLSWCVSYLTEDCQARAVIVWCRWRRERERLVHELRESKAKLVVRELYGGQKATDRTLAVEAFSSTELSRERKVLVAQQHAGGHGLNLVAASECIYLSNDFSWGMRVQSEDRAHRPGQVNKVLYTDVLATGPKGQKTIDYTILSALRAKEEVARWTTSRWRRELEEE
jgi:SNF2 family DNA or RNA helicase